MIKLSSSETQYPYIKKRDVYLEEEDIRDILSHLEYRQIHQFNTDLPLIYNSSKAAMDELQDMLRDGELIEKSISYSLRQGDPYLSGKATVDMKANHCLEGGINLLTGEIIVNKTVCYIIN